MHPSSELALIFFTILAQMAVGIVLVTQVAQMGYNAGSLRDSLRKQPLYALIFVGAAALLSTIHLGTTLHSPFTLLHVGSSWLSREIWILMLTGAAIGALAYFHWKDPDSILCQRLSIISCILGLILIYAMSKVYNSPFLPGWERASTFCLFLATALLLGGLWSAWRLGIQQFANEDLPKRAILRIFFFTFAGFILLAIFAPLSIPETASGINRLAQAYTQETIAVWQGFHVLVSGIGLLILCAVFLRALRGPTSTKWLFMALLFGICGEIIGRSAFYMSYARLGI